MAEILDESNSKEVVRELLKSDDFNLKSYEVLDFHNPLQGLVGDHFTLRISYEYKSEEKIEDFFVKTLSDNKCMLEMSMYLQVYEKEEFFYKILQEYEKYGIDTSFAPRGFFFKPYVIVLEDLSKKFMGTLKRKYIDLEHCSVCLETLAKFHASTIIYERRKGKELGRKFSLNDDNSTILEDKFASKNEDDLGRRWLVCSIHGLMEFIDTIPENLVSNEEFKAKLAELLSVEDSQPGLVSSILHADLWTNNFLYLYQDGRAVQSKILDFQLIKYGPVESDVVEFLMTNTSRSFRAENFETLLELYYCKLKECLEIDEVLPEKSEFLRSCDNFVLVGKVRAILDHCYTFLPDEFYGAALESEESFRKFLFEERGKCIIQACDKDEVFKNVILEDVFELRDLLFA